MVQCFIAWIEGLVILDFFWQHSFGFFIWRWVADIKSIFQSIFRTKHEVNKGICCFFIFHGFWNDNVIKPKVAGFSWNDIAKILIGFEHLASLSWESNPNSRIVLDHIAFHLISNQSFDVWRQGVEFIYCLLQFLWILFIEAIAQGIETNSHDLTRTIVHHDVISVLFTPEIWPMFRSIFNHLGIVDNPQGTPEIRYWILVTRIKRLVQKFWINIFHPFDLRLVQLFNQMLIHHLGNHVFTRNRNIVGGSPLLDLGVHGFVGIKGIILHLNSCFFGEFLEQFWIDIISPVVDDQLVTILGIHARFDLVANSPEDQNDKDNPS